jgi:hypothetical protein
MITTTHKLLTGLWTADVQTVEAAVREFGAGRAVTNDCQVAFFEVEHDNELHVNVTHKHATKNVHGWSGPATVASGFVHNRTFYGGVAAGIAAEIRRMVFAAAATPAAARRQHVPIKRAL